MVKLIRRGTRTNTIVSVAVVLAGCAAHPPATLQIESAHAAVERARAAGVQEAAGGDLQLALGKIELSRHLGTAGKHETARWLAEQAEVDAELAHAKAAAAFAVKEAERLPGPLRTVRRSSTPATR